MRCRKQPCTCKSIDYALEFRGLKMFLLAGVRCLRCNKKYGYHSILENMSIQYIDVMLKIILILAGVYYVILGYFPGVVFMFATIVFINTVVYPMLFKFGILIIDKRERK